MEASTMTLDKDDYLFALSKAHDDPESYQLVEHLIEKHFELMRHLKEASLHDILEYEKRIVNGTLEPMKILAYDNERLRKEVNKLRRQVGKIEKYKE
jgi:hypothetical protein